ncbi:MAG: N-acetyltransferase [Sphingobacteriales bacterium]|nr:MAG: N-acetyltransferase [Sphingobacteriales bacterium]
MTTIREAVAADIPAMHGIRTSVRENRLSDPGLITPADYREFMKTRGKGWVCTMGDTMAGFAIVDLAANNVWAMFVSPDSENRGVGKKLHDAMLHWYFSQTRTTLWLGTAPGTRAAGFYERMGWQPAGTHGSGEIKFEMNETAWISRKGE